MACLVVAVLLWISGGAVGLRDIQLAVPEAVDLGDTATLGCRWLLDDGETLYTVKWYRGAQEFFRYIPKELPHTRVFSQQGISVDVSRSGAQQVVLHSATRALAGRYRCEVSADAPYFHTVYKTAFMHVVELPESPPLIVAQKSWYTAGDTLRANCSSAAAAPPANLTWLLNGNEVKGFAVPPQPQHEKSPPDSSLEDVNTIIFSPWNTLPGYEEPVTDNVIDIPAVATLNSSRNWPTEPTKRPESRAEERTEVYPNGTGEVEEKSNKSSSASQLVLRVQGQHFRKGRLNLTCVANVYSVYSAKAELIVEEERPQIAPVMGSRDSNAELPESPPLIVAQKSWYTAGDTLRANCSSAAAAPPANLTWLLNGNEVKGFAVPPQPQHEKSPPDSSLEDVNTIIFSPWNTLPGYEEPVTDNVIDIPAVATLNSSRNWPTEPTKRPESRAEERTEVYPNGTGEVEEKSNKSSSASQLVLRVQGQHFRKGRLNLTCVANVYSVYSAKAELIVEEERPQIAPVMGSRDSNAGCRQSDGVLLYCALAALVLARSRLKGPCRWER